MSLDIIESTINFNDIADIYEFNITNPFEIDESIIDLYSNNKKIVENQ